MSEAEDTSLAAAFDRAVDRARDAVPDWARAAAQTVIVHVADWPDPAILREMGIDDPLELTGLYDGIPLTEKSGMDLPMGADIIWLYREPILDEWRSRGDVALDRLIAHVYVHELAHHFGWSDADIATIDRWWE